MKKLLLLLIASLCLISCGEETKCTYNVYTGRIVSYQHNEVLLDEVLIKSDNGDIVSSTCSNQVSEGLPLLAKYYFDNKKYAKITVRYYDGCTPEIYSIKGIK